MIIVLLRSSPVQVPGTQWDDTYANAGSGGHASVCLY